ncbi:unnamed protein product, partial [Meganyctiphanes norvegica]
MGVYSTAWACVSGSWALSSGEVSCGSCGYECQSACGTRNFRACCFNFQRRRRSDVAPRPADAPDPNLILDGSSYLLTDAPEDLLFKKHLRQFARNTQTNPIKDILTQILQESDEEDTQHLPELLMQPDFSLPLGEFMYAENPLLHSALQKTIQKRKNHFVNPQKKKKNSMDKEGEEMTLGKLLRVALKHLPSQILKEPIHLTDLTTFSRQDTQDNDSKNLSQIRK